MRRLLPVLCVLVLSLALPAGAAAQGPTVLPLPAPPGTPGENPAPAPTVIKQETTIIHQHQILLPTALLQEAIGHALTGLFQPGVEQARAAAQTLGAGLGLTGELPRLSAPVVERLGREGAKGAAALAVLVFVLRLVRYQWARFAGEGDTLMGVMADWLLGGVGALLCAPLLDFLLQLAVWAARTVQDGPWGDFQAVAGTVTGGVVAGGVVTGAAVVLLGLPLYLVLGVVAGILSIMLLAWVGLYGFLALVGPVVWVTGTLPELRWLRTWWLKAAVLLALVPALATLVGALLLRPFQTGLAQQMGMSVDVGKVVPSLAAGIVGTGLLLSLLGGIIQMTVGHTVALGGRLFRGLQEFVRLAGGVGGVAVGRQLAAGFHLGTGAAAGVPEMGAQMATRTVGGGTAAGAGAGAGGRGGSVSAPGGAAPTAGSAAQDAALLRAELAATAPEDPALRGLERAWSGAAGVAVAAALRRAGVVRGTGEGGVMSMEEARRVVGHLRTLTRAAGPGAVAGSDPDRLAGLVAALDQGKIGGPPEAVAATVRHALGLPRVPAAAVRDRLLGALRVQTTPEARLATRLLEGERGERLVAALQENGVLIGTGPGGEPTAAEMENAAQALLGLSAAYAGDPAAAAALAGADPEKVAAVLRAARDGQVTLQGAPLRVQADTRPLLDLGAPRPEAVLRETAGRLWAALPGELRLLVEGDRGVRILQTLAGAGVAVEEPAVVGTIAQGLETLWRTFDATAERAGLLAAAPEQVGAALGRLLQPGADVRTLEPDLRTDLGLPPLAPEELARLDRSALITYLREQGMERTAAEEAVPLALVGALRAHGLLGAADRPADAGTIARVGQLAQAFHQAAHRMQATPLLAALADEAAEFVGRVLQGQVSVNEAVEAWRFHLMRQLGQVKEESPFPPTDEDDPFRPPPPEATQDPVEVYGEENPPTEVHTLPAAPPPDRPRRRKGGGRVPADELHPDDGPPRRRPRG